MARRPPATRPRDAQATRRALLEAGIEAFRAVGYTQASTRAIGEQAGVDAALIKRYFGGKEGLYLAALEEMAPVDVPARGLVAWMVALTDARGFNPVSRAIFTAEPDDERRAAVTRFIERFLVEPLVAELELEGEARPDTRLRVELAAALVHGALLGREGAVLPTLAAASSEELVALLGPLIDELLATAEG